MLSISLAYWHHFIVERLRDRFLEFLVILRPELAILLKLRPEFEHLNFSFDQTQFVKSIKALVGQNSSVEFQMFATALSKLESFVLSFSLCNFFELV